VAVQVVLLVAQTEVIMVQILCLAQSLLQVVVMELLKQELAVGLVVLVVVVLVVGLQPPELAVLAYLGRELLEGRVLVQLHIRAVVVEEQALLV
jgi:hypothetical protein